MSDVSGLLAVVKGLSQNEVGLRMKHRLVGNLLRSILINCLLNNVLYSYCCKYREVQIYLRGSLLKSWMSELVGKE